jgi:hypothetical protein
VSFFLAGGGGGGGGPGLNFLFLFFVKKCVIKFN